MSEWNIIKGANDILICGPGNLIISLREFDRKKVEVIDKDVMGKTTLISRVRYPLDKTISLELTVLSLGRHTQIKLHVGDRIQWTIPEDFANSLRGILTASAVYSQSTVQKSSETFTAKVPKEEKPAKTGKPGRPPKGNKATPLAEKGKRKGPGRPKHQKISGRTLELQTTKVELGLEADKSQRTKIKAQNSALDAATLAALSLKTKPPKVAKPQSLKAKGKPGRPPKAKPALSADNVDKPKAKPGRPPKLAQLASAPAAPKATTRKKETRPEKRSKPKLQRKPQKEK